MNFFSVAGKYFHAVHTVKHTVFPPANGLIALKTLS